MNLLLLYKHEPEPGSFEVLPLLSAKELSVNPDTSETRPVS